MLKLSDFKKLAEKPNAERAFLSVYLAGPLGDYMRIRSRRCFSMIPHKRAQFVAYPSIRSMRKSISLRTWRLSRYLASMTSNA